MTLSRIERIELESACLKTEIEKLKEKVISHEPRVYGPMPNSKINKW